MGRQSSQGRDVFPPRSLSNTERSDTVARFTHANNNWRASSRGVSDNETQLLNDLRDANLPRLTGTCFLPDYFNYADVSFMKAVCGEKIFEEKYEISNRFFAVLPSEVFYNILRVEVLLL